MAVKQLGLSKKGVGGRVSEHEDAVREVEKEVNFYRRLNHPNIVRYLVRKSSTVQNPRFSVIGRPTLSNVTKLQCAAL